MKRRCTFTAITKMVKVPLLGCYFLVIICSDVMTVHFFFLVRSLDLILHKNEHIHIHTRSLTWWMWCGDRYGIREAGWKSGTASAISESWALRLFLCFCCLLSPLFTLNTSRLDHPNAILESKCDFSHSFSSQTSSLNSFMPKFCS